MNVEMRDRDLRNAQAAVHVQGQLIDMMCEERDRMMKVVEAARRQCEEWTKMSVMGAEEITVQYGHWFNAHEAELAAVREWAKNA